MYLMLSLLEEIIAQSAKHVLSVVIHQGDLQTVHDDFLLAAYFAVKYCRHLYLGCQMMRSINQALL